MLNKTKLMIGFLIASALLATTAFAAEDVTTQPGAGKLVIGANSASITIGLSTGVEARYVNPGTTAAEAQWYVAATVHSGGNTGYATAQNLTNIMKKAYQPGDPTSTILTTIPIDEASKELWVSDFAWLTQ